MDTTEDYNPIRQDLTKEGHLRAYDYGDMLFNYGMLPQTWCVLESLTFAGLPPFAGAGAAAAKK